MYVKVNQNKIKLMEKKNNEKKKKRTFWCLNWIGYNQCLEIDTFSREITSKLISPSWKWVYTKRKEFAPLGSKFFPLRVHPFSEGALCAGKQTGGHKSCFPCKKMMNLKNIPNANSQIWCLKLQGLEFFVWNNSSFSQKEMKCKESIANKTNIALYLVWFSLRYQWLR